MAADQGFVFYGFDKPKGKHVHGRFQTVISKKKKNSIASSPSRISAAQEGLLGRGVAYQGSLCIPQANRILAFIF